MKYICYNWFGTIANHCLDLSQEEYLKHGVSRLHNKDLKPHNVKENDIVFVKTDFIYHGGFQKLVLPHISKKFTLISGVSSLDVTKGHEILSILSNPFLKKWYCTNAPAYLSSKIIPIPIGFEEKERAGGNQKTIDFCYKNKRHFNDKKNKILLPYHTASTNPQRAELLDYLGSLDFVDVQKEKLSFEKYLNLLSEYKFVICLEGAGQDLHRFYETLLMGSIPVAADNCITGLFKHWGIPGVFVDQWNCIDKSIFEGDYSFDNVDSFLKIDHYKSIIKK